MTTYADAWYRTKRTKDFHTRALRETSTGRERGWQQRRWRLAATRLEELERLAARAEAEGIPVDWLYAHEST